MAFDQTDLVSTLEEAIKRFNNPGAGATIYDSYCYLLDDQVEEKEVDPTLSGGGGVLGPGKVHKTKNGVDGVLPYLKKSQKDKIPQFYAPVAGRVVAEAGAIGIISGDGTYQDDSKKGTKETPVKYCFVFAKTGGNWFLKVAFASRVP